MNTTITASCQLSTPCRACSWGKSSSPCRWRPPEGFVISLSFLQWTHSLWNSQLQPVSRPTPQLGSLQVQTARTCRPEPSFNLGDFNHSGPWASGWQTVFSSQLGRHSGPDGSPGSMQGALHRLKLLPCHSIQTPAPAHEDHTWFSNPALFWFAFSLHSGT